MLILLNICLFKYSKKSLKKSIQNIYIFYNKKKEFFRTVLKHIMIFYKNIYNPLFLNNFNDYKIQYTYTVQSVYKSENHLKNFYC